jgi:hypothetical protein
MPKRFCFIVVLFVVGLFSAPLARGAEEAGSGSKTNLSQPLRPGPDDGIIALVTARALEQNHYREQSIHRRALSIRNFLIGTSKRWTRNACTSRRRT